MNRADLKAHARQCMRNASPSTYLVTLLYLVAPFVFGLVMMASLARNFSGMYFSVSDLYGFYWSPFSFLNLYNIGSAMTLFGLIFAFALLYFLITVGYNGYCLRVSRGQDARIGNLFDFINKPLRFLGLTLLMSLISVAISLVGGLAGAFGSLAAMVASIYINLGLSQAVLVAIDRPELGIVDCLRESWALMQGRRWEFFVLQLSFIGWGLLCMFFFPIFFVMPYVQVTQAAYYNVISGWQPDDEAYGGY